MLWVQGESDISLSSLTYQTDLLKLINGSQNDILTFNNTTLIVFCEISGSNYDQYEGTDTMGQKYPIKKFVNDMSKNLTTNYQQ